MPYHAPIMIVDDDREDRELAANAIRSLDYPNEILGFGEADTALHHLQTSESPFLIISDIRMPKMDGLEFRSAIAENPKLKMKSIPFVFITGSADSEDVSNAYKMAVQGFFTKPGSVDEWRLLMDRILGYWKHCIHPDW
jgi:CheY-like chemotaxis protein